MANQTDTSERRQYTRFITKGGVVISMNSRFGELIDISFGGLSFRYLGNDEWPAEAAEGMLFGDDDFCWPKVPLKTVSDTVIENEDYEGSRSVRRRSMVFGDLSAKQMHQLVDFIQTNTVDIVLTDNKES